MTEEKRYCGLDWDQMNGILDTMCMLEDELKLSKEEQLAFDISIQCITTVMNRMKEDRPIEWD